MSREKPNNTVYGASWNGNLQSPTKDAVYDKIETIVGAVPTTITIANENTDTTCFVGFFTDATGNLQPKTNANLTFNSLTGVLTSASSVLTLTDINGGTIDLTTIGGSAPAGGTFTTAVANSFVPNLSTVPTNGMYLPGANTLGFAINSAAELQLTATALSPIANGGLALGASLLQFSNLFLGSNAVVNFNNGNATITHSAGLLTSNVDIAVPDEVYGAGWNGSLETPTKNAVYDKIEAGVSTVAYPVSNVINLGTLTKLVKVTATGGISVNTHTVDFDLTGLFTSNVAAIIQGIVSMKAATLNTDFILGTLSAGTPTGGTSVTIANGNSIIISKMGGSTPVSVTATMTSATNLRIVSVYGSAPGAAASSTCEMLVNNSTI